jgi:hypothetical protein
MMKKLFLPLLFLLFSCSSTHIVSSWREPNKEVTITNLSKVLVVAKFKSETSNRKAEDNMVAYLKGKGIPSYEYLKSNFNKENIDGALTMRLIDVEKEKISQRADYNRYPNNYRDFNNYFYESQMSYENPEYYVTTKVYTIETNVYSIKENKIIWTALTETIDPNGVEKMTSDVAKVVYKKMVEDGFVK